MTSDLGTSGPGCEVGCQQVEVDLDALADGVDEDEDVEVLEGVVMKRVDSADGTVFFEVCVGRSLIICSPWDDLYSL